MRKLFTIKGFTPYVIMLFLNAFIDLGHKIVIQNTVFKMYDGSTQVILTAIVNALILLPYVFLFTPTGFVADKYPKHLVMKYSALAEVVTMLLVIAAYYHGWFWCAFALTLSMAVQSAFYSPAKYGYIRELVGDNLLAEANGVVQAVTIAAILLGTLVFSALFELMLKAIPLDSAALILQVIYPLGIVLLLFAVLEWMLSFLLPAKRGIDASRHFSLNEYVQGRYLKDNVQVLKKKPVITLAIIGLITFWAASQVVLAVFPAFAKARLGETNTLVIQGIMACTAIGIVAGSLLAGRFSQNRIELGLIPVGIIGFALCIGLFPLVYTAAGFALLFITCGVLGGFFIVPMNALMQYLAEPGEMGNVLAANNWLQNLAMLLFLAITIGLSWTGVSGAMLFYLLMLAVLVPAVYAIMRLPQCLARWVYLWRSAGAGRCRVKGFSSLPSNGPALLLCQQGGKLDALLVQMACPRRVRFIIAEDSVDSSDEVAATSLLLEKVSGPRQAIGAIAGYLQQGHLVCILAADKHHDNWLETLQQSSPLFPAGVLQVPVHIVHQAQQADVLFGQAIGLEEPLHRVALAFAELAFPYS